MDDQQVISIVELEAERARLSDDLARLDEERSELVERISVLANVLDGVRRLRGLPDPEPASEPAGKGSATVRDRRNLRSRDMVVELLRGSDRFWTRREIHEKFMERYGDQLTWSAPVNAINNALGRAVEKGFVLESDGRYYARGDAVDTTSSREE